MRRNVRVGRLKKNVEKEQEKEFALKDFEFQHFKEFIFLFLISRYKMY